MGGSRLRPGASEIALEVRLHAGGRADETPRALRLPGGAWLRVGSVLARASEEEVASRRRSRWFDVEVEGGGRWRLRQEVATGAWSGRPLEPAGPTRR
jgi:hypothetical protein